MEPSATMLTYRLEGTTDLAGSTTTGTISICPTTAPGNGRPRTNLRAPWCAPKAGAALLTMKLLPPVRGIVFTWLLLIVLIAPYWGR